jgi:fumarylacetoacetase
MHLPMKIGGFVDFLTSKDHAERAGRCFGYTGPMPLNFFHLPIAYNGRASSVVVSGTEITRPWVQSAPQNGTTPGWGPCQALDYELEMVVP